MSRLPWGQNLGQFRLLWEAAKYVNRSASEMAEVPPGVVTVTSTGPANPAGEIAVIVVESHHRNSRCGICTKGNSCSTEEVSAGDGDKCASGRITFIWGHLGDRGRGK